MWNPFKEEILVPETGLTTGVSIPAEKKFRFDYVKLNGQTESFEVKYYNFVTDFIRLTLLDSSEVVLTSKDTVLDRFIIKEIKDGQ